MSYTTRIKKELAHLTKNEISGFRLLNVGESNIMHWKGLILPDKEPYNKGAFRISITFPANYPFNAPQITFQTKIYHPNINEEGEIRLAIINSLNWKPNITIQNVLEELLKLVNEPELDQFLRFDIALEFAMDRSKFNKNAKEFTKEHAEDRCIHIERQ